MRGPAIAVALVTAGAAAAQPAALTVVSDAKMELGFRTSFALAKPGSPLKYKATGPGRLNAVVVPGRAGPTKFTGSADVEAFAAGQSAPLIRESLSAARMLGLEASGAPGFLPSGPTKMGFDLLPGPQVYELKVSGPAAIAAFLQSGEGDSAKDAPLAPMGKPKAVKLRMREEWHLASVCERVRVETPGRGLLRVFARPLLRNPNEVPPPPPTFLRVLSAETVRESVAVTGSPDVALEFTRGSQRIVAGQPRTHEVFTPAAESLTLDASATGCTWGLGLKLHFEPNAEPSGEVAVARAPAKLGDDEEEGEATKEAGSKPARAAKAAAAVVPKCEPMSPEELVRAKLRDEDAIRRRAMDYLETLVASGAVPGSMLVVQRSSELGEAFVLQEVSYALDGQPLHHESSPDGNDKPVSRKVVPGAHTFEVNAVIKGRGSGAFAHLNDYVIRVKNTEAFVADAGRRYSATVKLEDRGGAATPFKERPAIWLRIKPE